MRVQVQKWGNSLALRLPKSFAQEIHLNQGSELEMLIERGKIILSPKKKPAYSLKKLLSGIKKENIHSEQEFGQPQGKEAW